MDSKSSRRPTRLSIEYVPIDDVKLAEGNPRAHNTDALVRSMERFGVRWPIIVNRRTGIVEAGHGRLKALRARGETEAPVIFFDDDDLTAVAFAVADNRIQELTEVDPAGLGTVLADLQEQDFDLGVIGYEPPDVEELMRAAGLATPPPSDDEAAAKLAAEAAATDYKPETQPGEVFELGPHRVICGDAAILRSQEVVLGERRVDLVLTDPPYGIDYTALRRADQLKHDATLEDGARILSEVIAYLRECETWFVFCSWRSLSHTFDAMKKNGIEPKACIVWDKGSRAQSLDRFYKRHEFLIYAGAYGGERTVEGDVWRFPRDYEPDHPTPKPVSLLRQAIQLTTACGDLVFDPFLGSGTTLIAADQLGRVCYGMEIEPRFCDVIKKRWERYKADDG